MRLILTIFLLILSLSSSAENIEPFTSDGCSAFPDGTFMENELWLSCCTAHDFAYWQGGTYDERLIADKELEHCVAQVGEPQIAALMLAGVRVGGSPYFPTTFRWGYGWPFPRLYKPLTEDEQLKINFQIQAMQESDISTYCQVATENTSLTATEQIQLEGYVLNNEFIAGCVTEKLADLAEKSSSKAHLCEQAKSDVIEQQLSYPQWLSIYHACRVN